MAGQITSIPYPQTPKSEDWNAAIVKINKRAQANYGIIDKQLDSIEQKKNEIATTIDNLEKAKRRCQVWLDFLTDLNALYSYCNNPTKQGTVATTNAINAHKRELRAYTSYGKEI